MMEITEVRIRPVRDNGKEKLRAFASVTFDNEFVVREVKVIEGDKGFFVAMPSRKVTERCRKCGCRNVVQAQYCNGCGQKLTRRQMRENESQDKLYMDVAHPINARCRKKMHEAVIGVYLEERPEAGNKSRDQEEDDAYYRDYDSDESDFDNTEEEDDSDPDSSVTESDRDDDSRNSFSKGIFA